MPARAHVGRRFRIQTRMIRSTTAAAATLLLLSTAFAAAPASDADKAFVAKVSQGGAYEVAASKYALTHAQAQDVIDLANSEVHDHTLVGARLKQISAAAGVPIAPALNDEFSDRLARLKEGAGQNFDQLYIEDMKSIHDKDEALFAQESRDGSGAFKAFAAQTDKIVKRHIGALAVNTSD